MPTYMTLAVLALAASTASPAFSAPLRVTRERAPTHSELINVERGLFGIGTAKVAEEAVEKVGGKAAGKVEGEAAGKVGEDAAAAAGKKGWGSRLKSMALNLAVGGAAAIAGTDIYEKINPNSKALGATGEPAPAPSSATGVDPTTGYPISTDPSYASGGYSDPGYTSSGYSSPGYTSSGYPSSGYTSSGYPSPGYTNTGYYRRATTDPCTVNTVNTDGADIFDASYYRRATTDPCTVSTVDTDGADIFDRSNSDLNSRTFPHKNLLSRTDLEKAITLFTRMLDELD